MHHDEDIISTNRKNQFHARIKAQRLDAERHASGAANKWSEARAELVGRRRRVEVRRV